MIVDLFLVYQFIKRLATPFEKWDAFEKGVIDKDGKVLVKKNNRTPEQKKSWGTYDVMIANIKKLLAKVPGGSSRLASYAAALYLIKEWNHFSEDSLLTEDTTEEQINESLDLFYSVYLNYTTLSEDVNQKIDTKPELEEVRKPAAARWKRAGVSGEIEATIGGKKYKIEKALDHNERHKGEWKVMVWDKRTDDWEWETTEYGKANAKAWVVDRMNEEPLNSVGSGNIAGMDGSAFSKAAQKRWTSSNKTKKKRLRDIMGDIK
jgi:hypothetical protein